MEINTPCQEDGDVSLISSQETALMSVQVWRLELKLPKESVKSAEGTRCFSTGFQPRGIESRSFPRAGAELYP